MKDKEDYVPYSEAWVNEVMKMPKKHIIENFLAPALKKIKLLESSESTEPVEGEWMRVEDGLPELIDESSVDILTYPHYIECSYGEFDNYFTSKKETGFYKWSEVHDNDIKVTGITHWMIRPLLPSPPNNSNGG